MSRLQINRQQTHLDSIIKELRLIRRELQSITETSAANHKQLLETRKITGIPKR